MTGKKAQKAKQIAKIKELRKECKEVQSELKGSLKKQVKNVSWYLILIIILHKILPKLQTLSAETPSLYGNWTFYAEEKSLNEDIRMSVGEKTQEMNNIVVKLFQSKDMDYIQAKKLLTIGHDCLQISKRVPGKLMEVQNLISEGMRQNEKKVSRIKYLRI